MLADRSPPYLQRHPWQEVPTKVLESTSRPCPGAVARRASMAQRRQPWTALDAEDTKRQVQTYRPSTERAESLGEERPEAPTAESP
jgi:hypothetical protein